MQKVIGYKLFKVDGTSLNGEFKYDLPKNGKPGKWHKVPGNGSYVADLGGDLFAGGCGDVVAKVECKSEVKNINTPYKVRCWRNVRIIEIGNYLNMLPIDSGEWRYYAARDVEGLTNKQRWELVKAIPIDSGEWRYRAACYVEGLTDDQEQELLA